MRFEVITAVNVKITGCWDVSACSLVESYRNCIAVCCLHVQRGGTENGSSRSLRNVSYLYFRPYGITLMRTVTLGCNIKTHCWGIFCEDKIWVELAQDMAQQYTVVLAVCSIVGGHDLD